MNKMIVTVVAVALGVVQVFGEANGVIRDEKDPRRVKKISQTVLQQAIYKKTGGKLIVPNSAKGNIVIVNSSKLVPSDVLKGVVSSFGNKHKIAMTVKDGDFDIANPKAAGELNLFVIDSETLPVSLFAPEGRWAMINVAKLKHEKPQFTAARVRKESVRMLAYLCGASNSQYPNSLISPITKLEELDRFESDSLPTDVTVRFETYLPSVGIQPYKMKSYRAACTEGWAPQPTNDVQKAIWDDVHTLPTKPIVIEPEKK